MAGKFVLDGGQVTITFEYGANLQVAQDTVKSAAKLLFAQGYLAGIDANTDFETLKPQDWLNILDEYILKRIVELAKIQFVVDAEKLARSKAEIEANEKFITP